MLSGGAAPSSSKILVQVQELIEVENKLREVQQRLNASTKEEETTREKRTQWKGLLRELEIKQHELKLLQEQVEGSNASMVSLFSLDYIWYRRVQLMSYTQIASQVEQAKATIESLQQALQDAKEKQLLAYEEVKKLERDMEEFKNNKEGKIEELKVHVYPFSRPMHILRTEILLSFYPPTFPTI